MIDPPPYKVKCPECGYRRTIRLKGDVLNAEALAHLCPHCHISMEAMEPGMLARWLNKILPRR